MKICKDGCTRLVFLIGRWAIKIPRLDYGWAQGLRGLLANMQEVEFAPIDDRACPIVFRIRGGFLIVMKRCEPITEEQWKWIGQQCPMSWMPIPVEFRKRSSWGSLNGKIVMIDFGS